MGHGSPRPAFGSPGVPLELLRNRDAGATESILEEGDRLDRTALRNGPVSISGSRPYALARQCHRAASESLEGT
jgi:hypothetical protein